MYSVITLDVNQESLTDEAGNNIAGDLKIVAIEENAGAFRSVFNNYADEPLFYFMHPASNPVTRNIKPCLRRREIRKKRKRAIERR
jgi:hypothetical protein